MNQLNNNQNNKKMLHSFFTNSKIAKFMFFLLILSITTTTLLSMVFYDYSCWLLHTHILSIILFSLTLVIICESSLNKDSLIYNLICKVVMFITFIFTVYLIPLLTAMVNPGDSDLSDISSFDF